MRPLSFCLLALALLLNAAGAQPKRPNVVLIITDDQGYGDLGLHGNPKIHTPHLDRLGRESVRFERFYVSPVCAPTRAALMTGRYNYRTGVTDTYLGRALMYPDEVTLAERLSGAGYRTGLFGKWHLGDNYPLRAIDQGFHEALSLNGGGIGQPSDPVGGESYFDPILFRNGVAEKTKGYVSDVITDAAIQFIERNQAKPFFTYLAFNAPHTPLEAPPELAAKYAALKLTAADFPNIAGGHPIPPAFDAGATAKIYAMVENIDANVGRLLQRLEELKLAENTVVIFLTDNGPQQARYNAGMFQRKGNTHEGGIRVPFFVRWPGRFAARVVNEPAAHIDVTPTLVDLCGAAKPARVKFDGVSLRPLLEGKSERLADRMLFAQWHRGDAPERYRAFAARTRQYKLVQPNGANDGKWEPVFKLYDLQADPYESQDLAAAKPEVVAQLRAAYDGWFNDVTGARDYRTAARIFLGAPAVNTVRLTRQDWRGPAASWDAKGVGHWEVNVVRGGAYDVTARINPSTAVSKAYLALGKLSLQQDVPAGATTVTFKDVALPTGAGQLQCWLGATDARRGVLDLEVRRRAQY